MTQNNDIFDRVSHHYADNDGVKLHYTSIGEGPTLLFVHGFPDFWYTWRYQMAELSKSYRCVAPDLRGYNESGKPAGVENYSMGHLLKDVHAWIDALGGDPVTLIGHDWGGGISWRFAMLFPERLERLIICNLTHPRGYTNVIRNATPEQQKNTQYMADYQAPDAAKLLSPENLTERAAGSNPDAEVRARYMEAFEKSDFDAMLNYYRASYTKMTGGPKKDFEPLDLPVLQFHGLQDTAVDKDGLRDTWNWIGRDYTLVTTPDAGHWVQREAADLVTTTMSSWLADRI